ncbi:MAG: hypothetical protein WA957_09265, partial [Alteraurantiacibacter sp.]
MSEVVWFAQQAPVDTDYIAELDVFCVLTVQRSGSTMLSRLLTQDGSFGIVEEHVNRLQVNARSSKSVPSLIREWSQAGRSNNSSTFGIKLMQNQLAVLGAWVTPPIEAKRILDTPSQQPNQVFSERAISWLQKSRSFRVLKLRRSNLFA